MSEVEGSGGTINQHDCQGQNGEEATAGDPADQLLEEEVHPDSEAQVSAADRFVSQQVLGSVFQDHGTCFQNIATLSDAYR